MPPNESSSSIGALLRGEPTFWIEVNSHWAKSRKSCAPKQLQAVAEFDKEISGEKRCAALRVQPLRTF
jgi:hypothetical protein